MYQKILNDPLVFGDDIGQEARSILTGLLTRDPTQRLGVNGAEEIRTHPFFAHHIDFQKLIQKKIQPPFKPSVVSNEITISESFADRIHDTLQASAVDTSNFDQTFTSEPALDSVVESTTHLSETVQEQFAGFSYSARGEDLSKSVTGAASFLE